MSGVCRCAFQGGLRALPALLLLVACSGPVERETAAPESPGATAPPFEEVALAMGVDFVHFNGMSGRFYVPEMMGPGAALLDYDGDGDLDLYVVQGRWIGDEADPDRVPPSRSADPPGDRLYRNELDGSGPRSLRFEDVTDLAGLEPGEGYGMGVATGDFDGDGRPDLYVTAFGPNRLLRNDGRGGFEDVTEAAGAGDEAWSIAAAFVDLDRDGHQDLYVGNFLDFRLAGHRPCESEAGWPDYCGPLSYRPLPDRLLMGTAAGAFRDASVASGIRSEDGNTLGVVPADFDGDGWLDLYVANDSQPNFLWRNLGSGRFENVAGMAGAAVNDKGQPEASMGVDAADFDGDGDEDLFMSHLSLESNTLYRNLGEALFEDGSVASRLAVPSLPYTGFGTAFLDVVGDRRLDVFVANGAINRIEAQIREGVEPALRQRDQLFRNLGDGAFEEKLDFGFADEAVSRGVSVGDLDNDGDPDLVVTVNAGPVRILRNTADPERWLGLRLV
ncbi:MAG: VCBS repeat-containing protein, partial [Thermoanaerobaculia bacterium]|nr:VCBS repeat-containing protein [Thermoanaerobaculia bacterium]